MAIYRLEKKSISRGNNHNLVAAVAYRAGAKFTDTNTKNPKATTHDYTKKTDVAHSEIMLPDELAEQLSRVGITLDLEQIANLVERGETTQRGKIKEKAKLASEYVLAGSHELSQADNIQAFHDFAKQQAEEQGVVAMVFVHDPKHGEDMSAGTQAADSSKGGDLRNIHAHVVLLSRQLKLSGDQLELGNKSDSELSDTDRKKKGLEPSRQWLKGVREQWADIQNKSLQRHNLAPVTHKSYKDLGLKFKPTKHLGKHANAMERMGTQTYLGTHNESINQYNIAHLESAASRLAIAAEQASDRSKQWVESVDAGRGGVERRLERSKQLIGRKKRVSVEGKSGVDWTGEAVRDDQQRVERSQRQTNAANNLIAAVISRRQHTNNTVDDSKRAVATVINRCKQQRRRANQSATESSGSFDADSAVTIFSEQSDRFDQRYAETAGRISAVTDYINDCRWSWSMSLVQRHRRNYDERQRLIIDNFVEHMGITTTNHLSADAARTAEILTPDVIAANINIMKILHDPVVERELHIANSSKMRSDAQQINVNSLTRGSTSNDYKTSNTANESAPVSSKRNRP